MHKLLAAGAVCLALMTASAQALDAASPEARAADIAAFRAGFLALDRSFSTQARAEAETRLAALETNRSAVSQAWFDIELARIGALADNGHTGVHLGRRLPPHDRVPVRLVPFGEDFYVLRASEAHAGLLGARLVAVDDHPIGELRAAARTLSGGAPAWRDRWSPFFLESPAHLHALDLAARPDRATYAFERPNGAHVRTTLAAEAVRLADPPTKSSRWLHPQLVSGETGWRALLAVEAAPWSLHDPDQPFRLRDAREIDAFVIDMRQNISSRTHDIAEFMFAAEDAVRAAGRRHIVLDMRMNGGGDLNTTRAFMRRLPALAPGRIFVLTSPWTFSAAISSTGYLEQAAPDRVTIVGEQVGDRPDSGPKATAFAFRIHARSCSFRWNATITKPAAAPSPIATAPSCAIPSLFRASRPTSLRPGPSKPTAPAAIPRWKPWRAP